MTRSKQQVNGGSGNSVVNEKESSNWVFIVKKDEFKKKGDCSEDPVFVKLKHPQTGEPTLFLFSADNKEVHEVVTFNEDKRSWFIDKSIIPNGKLFISTPIDPLFLVLPYLQESSQCSPLDQIMRDADFPGTERLLECSGLENIHKIADQRGDESLNAFVFNEDKTLSWLQGKAERLAEILKQKNINVSQKSAVSANFIKTETEKDSIESYLRYSFGIISEYLSNENSLKLSNHLKLPSEIENKRKEALSISTDDEQESKKVKLESTESEYFSKPESSAKAVPKTPTISAKEKARAKAAAGSKNISSFFQKRVTKN